MTLAPCASITSRQLAAPLMAARWNLEVKSEESAQSSCPSAITPQAVGTHADLPSESSFVGTSPLRTMREATRAASLFSTACSSRSSLLPQSWLCGGTPSGPWGRAAADLSPLPVAGAPGSHPRPWALAWRLPLAAGFGMGQGPQGGQEPRSVGLSRNCRGRWSWVGA